MNELFFEIGIPNIDTREERVLSRRCPDRFHDSAVEISMTRGYICAKECWRWYIFFAVEAMMKLREKSINATIASSTVILRRKSITAMILTDAICEL